MATLYQIGGYIMVSIIKRLLPVRMGVIMIRKNWIAMALLLALLGCGALHTLPIWGVSEHES